MQRPEEEARREGILLLEVHVKLLREARAALCSPGRGAENKLLDEIEKVEKKIEVWRRRYEDLYLHGNDLWDLIEREEELGRNRERKQKIKEEDMKIRAKVHSKQLREKKNRNLGKINHENEEEEEKMPEDDEQKAISGKQLTAVTSLVEDKREGKEEEIMSQPRDENEEVERLRPHKSEEKGRKRPRDEMEKGDEDGEKCTNRKRSGGADTSVARQAKDHRVLVQNIPLSVQYSELRGYFTQFGAVNKVYLKKDSGYGFVVYENEDIADLVCGLRHRLGEQDVRVIKDTPLVTLRARTCSDDGRTDRGNQTTKEGGVTNPARPNPGYQVFVQGIAIPMDMQGFKMALAHLGTVVSAYMPEDKNYAFVGFETQEAQQAALKAGSVNLPYGRALIRPATRR